MKVYAASVIADYFRLLTNPEYGDAITNLKLQKLCYYAAGVAAAVRRSVEFPLFNEPIEAWTHGPVVPTLYRAFKDYGAAALPPVESFDIDQIERRDQLVLNDVHQYYGQFSAWKLRDMTHEETPWIVAKNRPDKIITTKDLIEYFSDEFDEDYKKSYLGAVN